MLWEESADVPFPVSWQDMAKSFAGCTDGKTKYALYTEATGFDTIITELKKAQMDVASMKDNLGVMRTSVEARPALQLHIIINLDCVLC